MSKNKVILELVNDDWTRLYFNDEVIVENHSISNRDWMNVCRKLGAEVEQRVVKELFPSV